MRILKRNGNPVLKFGAPSEFVHYIIVGFIGGGGATMVDARQSTAARPLIFEFFCLVLGLDVDTTEPAHYS